MMFHDKELDDPRNKARGDKEKNTLRNRSLRKIRGRKVEPGREGGKEGGKEGWPAFAL
jgi:hypothetical protein